ncbi:MAG: ABC transporter ATP-binding protein [Ardenticatenaceae bacterium]
MSTLILELDELTKVFGGLTAVNKVSSRVERGQIKAIIGPNGAGKTTLYNLITGVYPVTSGDIRFQGQSLVGMVPNAIASLGITRTFQNIKLFDNMSVIENVMVGQHARTKAGFWAAAFRTKAARLEEAAIRARAIELLEFVGLLSYADSPASDLPFGLQRKLEIARALATQPTLILLDEPAAGLNNTESQELVALIRRIRDTGVTVLLVEHDMSVVMGLADEILVLEYGTAIADAPPQVVQDDPRVIAAYLGEEE